MKTHSFSATTLTAAGAKPAPEVLSMAKQIRQAYIGARSTYHAQKTGEVAHYHVPKRYDGTAGVILEGGLVVEKSIGSVWIDLAKKFLHHKFEPSAYVHAQFQMLFEQRPPEPNELLSQACLEKWHRVSKARGDEIRDELQFQKQLLQQQVGHIKHQYACEEKQAVLHLLTHPNSSFSALFRFCIARAYQLQTNDQAFGHVAQVFLPAAAMQYHPYRKIYARVWADLLPANFDEVADEVYAARFGEG